MVVITAPGWPSIHWNVGVSSCYLIDASSAPIEIAQVLTLINANQLEINPGRSNAH